VQAPACCCDSPYQAAKRGHYECFTLLLPRQRRFSSSEPRADVWLCLRLALRRGNVGFVKHVFVDYFGTAQKFARLCLRRDDPVGLQLLLDAASPHVELRLLAHMSTMCSAPQCLRVLFDNGVPWNPWRLRYPAAHNNFSILEVVLQHTNEWVPSVPGIAGCLGHVRFLMRIFEAGCPVWAAALDGEPERWLDHGHIPMFFMAGQVLPVRFSDSSLVVAPDLVRSGPVLLYAAQKGVCLTPRMEGMLGEVRRRALALAGCFHRASRLSQTEGAAAEMWLAMGLVPVEIVTRIATLAKLSIVDVDLVE
jgi:hypothetical protein